MIMPDRRGINTAAITRAASRFDAFTTTLNAILAASSIARGGECEPAGASADSFQSRVKPWMDACFGPEISSDRVERNHRFIEEALELVQANGCARSEAHQLVDYVYDRPVGELHQEIGGVMVTLAALCLASGADMHEAGEAELARVWTKIEKIRAKQAAKPKHSPLPQHVEPAGASEELCRRLALYALAEDILSSERRDLEAAASLIRWLVQELDEALSKAASLQQQAECWAMEARGANATIGEAYQAVTGATGEPGNWNGARPIKDALADARSRATTAESEVTNLRGQLDAAHSLIGLNASEIDALKAEAERLRVENTDLSHREKVRSEAINKALHDANERAVAGGVVGLTPGRDLT